MHVSSFFFKWLLQCLTQHHPTLIHRLHSALGNTTCTSSYCPGSPIATRALALSTEMKVASASASFFPAGFSTALDFHAKLVAFRETCDQLQHADDAVTFPVWRTECRGGFSSLECEYAVRLTPTMWHSACATPPATHAVFLFFSP